MVKKLHKLATDLTNKKFGKLKVKCHTKLRATDGSIIWHCICDCGNTKNTSSKLLINGKSVSCGYGKGINLLNKVFSRLVVKSRAENYGSNRQWNCECVCGNFVKVRGSNLVSGTTKSCGCLLIDTITKHGLSNTKEYARAQESERRARKMNNTLNYAKPILVKFKFDFLGNICLYCNDGEYESIDHIIPLSKGGTHDIDNLVPSCLSCNCSKHNKILFEEWQPKVVHSYFKN